jgi:hypothetical protein
MVGEAVYLIFESLNINIDRVSADSGFSLPSAFLGLCPTLGSQFTTSHYN